jgi:hypothetical protein
MEHQQWVGMLEPHHRRLGVFLRVIGLMYLASVALDRCPVWSMIVRVGNPAATVSVQ